jgi:hypothetical protein
MLHTPGFIEELRNVEDSAAAYEYICNADQRIIA